MKTILQIERPYVHGSAQLSWVEPVQRVHVFSDALTVNAVPVIIEGVLVREGDEWAAASFAVQRATEQERSPYWKTSRRNQERARDVILDVVNTWAGGRPQEIQPPRYTPESREGSALLIDLLA